MSEEEIDRMFPNKNFHIAIDIEEIDDIITDKKSIIVKNEYNCYCYDGNMRPTDYFYITGDVITNKVILNKLVEDNLCLECNHIFVEGFSKINDCMFEIMVGS